MSLIYDVHTHVGLDLGFLLRGWWPYAATASDLLEHMGVHGIDRAVCFPFTLPSAFDPHAFAERGAIELLAGRVPFADENRRLADELDRIDIEHRLSMLAMFDPSRRVDQQIANLEKLAGRIAGLKVQSTTIESPIRSLLDVGRDLMGLAQQHGWPVLMHTALLPQDDWAQVADCLAVAEAFGKVRFNLAHSLRLHAGHLRTAARLDNVWVDCAAHLAHCQLAHEDSPLVAARSDRVDADYARPAAVMEAIHEILGRCYLWGSDAPFMSWCDEKIRILYTYRQEVEVLQGLPEAVRLSMSCTGPEAWLLGKKAIRA